MTGAPVLFRPVRWPAAPALVAGAARCGPIAAPGARPASRRRRRTRRPRCSHQVTSAATVLLRLRTVSRRAARPRLPERSACWRCHGEAALSCHGCEPHVVGHHRRDLGLQRGGQVQRVEAARPPSARPAQLPARRPPRPVRPPACSPSRPGRPRRLAGKRRGSATARGCVAPRPGCAARRPSRDRWPQGLRKRRSQPRRRTASATRWCRRPGSRAAVLAQAPRRRFGRCGSGVGSPHPRRRAAQSRSAPRRP